MSLGLKEESVLINRLRINYKIIGEGKPILILHGWASSSDSWLTVQEKLSSSGYKVISPDFPGFGKSQDPPKSWSVGDYGDWLLAFVSYLRIKKFILLAHSFGGRVAIKLAANYPDKLEKLILSGSAGLKLKPRIKARVIRILVKIGKPIFKNRFLKRFKTSAQYLLYFFLRGFLKDSDYLKAEGVMRETMKKVISEDLLPSLSRIKTKTLLIWGKNDRMVPLKYAKIFKKNIKKSELKVIPGVGHSPNLEAPEELSKIIINFLAK